MRAKLTNSTGRPKFSDLQKEVLEAKYEDVELIKSTDMNEAVAEGDNKNYRIADICSICMDLLYDDNYVCVEKVSSGEKIIGSAICPMCLHTGRNELRQSFAKIYRVKFPLSAVEKINRLPISARKKDILKCALLKCIPGEIKENGIVIKYMNLGDKYIAISSKYHNIRFTKFCASTDKKIIVTYDTDKTLD